MRRGLRRVSAPLVLVPRGALLALTLGWSAQAMDADDARAEAARDVQNVRADVLALHSQLGAEEGVAHSAEQLIAAGDLALRSKNYEQAIDTLSRVVELFRQGKAGANAHADGLFLLGESYFEAGQLLSARRHYSELLDLASQPAYAAYAGRSLARLVDVALRTGHLESLATVQEQAARVSAADPSGSFDYGRGKLQFALGHLAEAAQILGAVPTSSGYHHQAQYVLGTILVKQALAEAGAGQSAEAQARLVLAPASARFGAAINQFRKLTKLAKDSAPHGQVIDLAWLAIARLYYESEAYLDAEQAYLRVDKNSAVYFEMLFELAWVYVRKGDYQRAERSLELLAIAAPNTLDLAETSLLRGDLMLRSGRFERALSAYQEVRQRFEPARAGVESLLATTRDPAVYYDLLVDEGLGLGNRSKLPDIVLQWVRQEARDSRVFAMIDDVTHAREVLRRSQQLASKLNTVLGAPSRARALPELKAGLEKRVGLVNQLARARRVIALGLEDADDSGFSGELGRVRAERRALMSSLANAPVTPADFMRREEQGNRSWNRVSQALQRATLETDGLQALINGLEQVLREGDKQGVTRDRASRARFRAEIAAHERDLATYRKRISSYRENVESGRLQLGFGDRRYLGDARARDRFRELLDRELVLLSSSQSGSSREYAQSVTPLLAEVRALERQLNATLAALELQVSAGVERLRQLVAEESEHILIFSRQLEALDQQARALVGEVAMQTFAKVRDHLKGIVLRADVGIVQEAWELREEQQGRLRGLQRQRALEERNLEDELREVFDDAGEEP
jgi:tetratricopeptide (TPR) repeat protein